MHLTTPESVDAVQVPRRRGVAAYTETCPHYLALDESSYSGEYPERYTCCPPLRSAPAVGGLNTRVLAGAVDTIGSDHCCFSTEQKSYGADDVTHMPNGFPGVETRLPVAFTELVDGGGMSLEDFVALFAANSAWLNGLPDKGVIAPGADADLVVLDPQRRRTVTAESVHMATDYTPYEGRALVGWPTTVISAGQVVLDDRGFHDPGPVGRPLEAQSIR